MAYLSPQGGLYSGEQGQRAAQTGFCCPTGGLWIMRDFGTSTVVSSLGLFLKTNPDIPQL